MNKNHGINAEFILADIKRLIGGFFLNALAEETEGGEGGTQTNQTNTPQLNYEDLIAKARKEEKDKQYKTIEGLKNQVKVLQDRNNELLLENAGLKEQSNNGSSSKDTRISELEGEVETLKGKLAEYESKPPVSREDVEREVRATLEQEYEVRTYRMEQLTAHSEDILVPELVTGSTKEEIDASIQTAIEKSNGIRDKLGRKRTPKAPSNPNIGSVQSSEVSMEDLAKMDVRSPEYRQLRAKLGLK